MKSQTTTVKSTSSCTSAATKRSQTKDKVLTTPSASGLKRFSNGLQARIRSVGYVSPQCAMAAVMCVPVAYEPIQKLHAHAVQSITGTSFTAHTAAVTSKSKCVQNPNKSETIPPINTSSPSKFCTATLSKAPRKERSWLSKTFDTPPEMFFDTVTSPW